MPLCLEISRAPPLVAFRVVEKANTCWSGPYSPQKKMELEPETPGSSTASPGGSREYKVVMLGSGGVGKSGKFFGGRGGWEKMLAL